MTNSINHNQKAIEWVQAIFEPELITPLACDVITILDKLWGIHNYGIANLDKTDWGNDHHIIVRNDRSLSTVDSNNLTALVVICHEMMLRLEINGRAKGYLELMFHKRKSRNIKDGFWAWCPILKDHVNLILRPNKEEPMDE